MKLQAIQDEWDADSVFQEDRLAEESLKTPKLHSKYYKFYLQEKLTLEKEKFELSRLEHLLWQYYSKKYDTETGDEILKELNRKDFSEIKYIGKEIDMMVEGDAAVVEKKKMMALQYEKVEYLKAILSVISTRNFMVRNAIEWRKFSAGT